MAFTDIPDIQAAGTTKIVGSDTTGVEQTPVGSTTNGELKVNSPNQLPASLGQKTMAASTSVTIASDQGALPITPAGPQQAEIFTSSYPDPGSRDSKSYGNVNQDAFGNLMIRGPVFTDEGSYRDDFSGSALATTMTGTATFSTTSTAVVGVGTSFTTQIQMNDYIKRSTDTDAAWVQVSQVIDDTHLVLVSNYAGTSGTSAIQSSHWLSTTSGTGAYSVSASNLVLTSGTASGNLAMAQRGADYLPFDVYFKSSISQRIANQTTIIGMQDVAASPNQQAVFVFDGTITTTVKCRSSFSSASAEIQETVVTIPSGGVSSSTHLFEIDISANAVSFLIDKTVVAQHLDHLPSPYTPLSMVAYIQNTAAAASSTTVSVDWVFFENIDQLEVTSDSNGEPIPVALMGKSTVSGLPIPLNLDSNGNLIVTPLGGVGANFSFGQATTTGTFSAPLRKTAYTEQTTNGQRSLASSSAADASAGTGAQTVTITYFDQTGVGPYTETVTLNGTTRVNTVGTNICYVEKITVSRVGSGLVSAGTITLYTTPTSGGVAIGTIAAGDNQTFWAHHYVQSGKTCRISGISGSTDQTSSAYALLFLRSLAIGVTGAPEIQVSDSVRVYGGASETVRNYNSPLVITGPARVLMYTTPSSNSSQNTFGAFDFAEA